MLAHHHHDQWIEIVRIGCTNDSTGLFFNTGKVSGKDNKG